LEGCALFIGRLRWTLAGLEFTSRRLARRSTKDEIHIAAAARAAPGLAARSPFG